MSEWTKSAKETVETRLRGHAGRFSAEGAEATEVVEDLRRHIDQEVARLGIRVVTEEDVLRIMAGIDPALVDPRSVSSPPPSPTPDISAAQQTVEEEEESIGATLALWIFGVILPAVALVFEWFSRISAEGIFDPMPTWFHVALIALVPLSSVAVLVRMASSEEPVPPWMRWLLSFATGVSLTYAVLFLPISPFAVIGILFYGAGLLPLSPLFAFICLLVLEKRCRRRDEAAGVAPHRPWIGGAGAVAILGALALPGFLTSVWLEQAVGGTAKERDSAVRWLRRIGDEEKLLRACYWSGRGFFEEISVVRRIAVEDAQKVYFRVTGLAFNSVKPPLSSVRGAGRQVLNDFTWDSGLGGESVGGRVTGLSMASSRLDAMAHAADGWGYVEWTMEFRNDHEFSQREARAVLRLPAGGVVSRVTLWVNDEEREAAFAGRSLARKAYQSVAVQQRRDPILVTTAGPDRVLMQCFPIQPKGGVMRVRLGITVPLEALSEDRVAFAWPGIAEQNFSAEDTLKHHVWLEIPDGTLENETGWPSDASRPNTVHATFSNRAAEERLAPVFLRRAAPTGLSWARDDRSSPSVWIGRGLGRTKVRPASRIAFVFDGGTGGKAAVDAARRALAMKDGRGEFAVWISNDGEHRLPDSGTLTSRSEVVRTLDGWEEPFAGGHDPLGALEAAWDWASATPDGIVLWFHGAQPYVIGDVAGMSQRLERAGGASPTIIDVMNLPVPDHLTGTLPQNGHLKAVARVGALHDDIFRLLGRIDGSEPGFDWTLEKSSTEPAVAAGSRHLVRLWAKGESSRLASTRDTTGAVSLAARWQLVTPVSGAVVLETQEQFKAHGLEAVDPLTTPGVVPEPETWALLVVGSVMVLWFHARQRKEALRTR